MPVSSAKRMRHFLLKIAACACWNFPKKYCSSLWVFKYTRIASPCLECAVCFWRLWKGFPTGRWQRLVLIPTTSDTWDARVLDPSSSDTEIQGPLELPYRYLFWKALRSHLYTFTESVERGISPHCACLRVLPDGRLVHCRSDGVAFVWNLETKTAGHLFGYGLAIHYEANCCTVWSRHQTATFLFVNDGKREEAILQDFSLPHCLLGSCHGRHSSQCHTFDSWLLLGLAGLFQCTPCDSFRGGYSCPWHWRPDRWWRHQIVRERLLLVETCVYWRAFRWKRQSSRTLIIISEATERKGGNACLDFTCVQITGIHLYGRFARQSNPSAQPSWWRRDRANAWWPITRE